MIDLILKRIGNKHTSLYLCLLYLCYQLSTEIFFLTSKPHARKMEFEPHLTCLCPLLE